jgi:hypothetical protein
MEILTLLQSNQNLTEADIFGHLWTFMSKKDFDVALESLQAAKMVFTQNVGGKPYLRAKVRT